MKTGYSQLTSTPLATRQFVTAARTLGRVRLAVHADLAPEQSLKRKSNKQTPTSYQWLGIEKNIMILYTPVLVKGIPNP
jgi:hypothetical protein